MVYMKQYGVNSYIRIYFLICVIKITKSTFKQLKAPNLSVVDCLEFVPILIVYNSTWFNISLFNWFGIV